MADYIFYVHLTSLALAVAGILYADMLAMSWMRHKKERLDVLHLRQTHTLVSLALVLLIASGAYLAWPMLGYLLGQPLFWVKMAFVATLVANSFAVGNLMHHTTRRTFRSMTMREKAPLFLSGAVSMMCWAGAGITALLLFG